MTKTTTTRALLTRRRLLAAGAAAAWPAGVLAQAAQRRFEPQVGGWRAFEMTTTVDVADHQGTTRVWLPVADLDTEWQRTVDHQWTGNANAVRLVADPARGPSYSIGNGVAECKSRGSSVSTSRPPVASRLARWIIVSPP